MRLRAIACCLWFGLMHWRVYEKTCHFKDGYWRHAWRNIKQSLKWLTFKESNQDREFERNTNTCWRGINWFGGLRNFIAKRLVWVENKDSKIQFYPDDSFRVLFRKKFATYEVAYHSKTDDLSFIGGGHGASGDACGL